MPDVAKLWVNRIVGYGDESPEQLTASPWNFRIHPGEQQNALLGILNEIGVVQNIIVSKRSGYVVDGHLRVMLALQTEQPTVPVTYVDLTEAEEKLVISTLDPLAALAVTDAQKLNEILKDISTAESAVMEMLSDFAAKSGIAFGNQSDPPTDPGPQTDKAEELQKNGRLNQGICGQSRAKMVNIG